MTCWQLVLVCIFLVPKCGLVSIQEFNDEVIENDIDVLNKFKPKWKKLFAHRQCPCVRKKIINTLVCSKIDPD